MVYSFLKRLSNNKHSQMKIQLLNLILLVLPLIFPVDELTGQTLPTRIITDADLGGNTVYYWSNDTIYLLDGFVYLEENSTLQIQAGTIIKAKFHPTPPNTTTALIITKSARLEAKGTRSQPIIFTSEIDDTNFAFDLDKTHRGLWGGIVLLGKGKLANSTQNSLPELPADDRNQYGGELNNDYSGVLQYVSIRYAGSSSNDSNFAGLFLGGIGNNTIIDYVEVYTALGDGFKIHGGAVNLKHSVAAFCGEDAFDWNFGWQGNGQYWFAIQASDKSGNTIDAKNDGAAIEDIPKIYNGTFIGPGQTANNSAEAAVSFSGNGAGIIANSLFIDFRNYALFLEQNPALSEDSWQQFLNGKLQLLNNTWSLFSAGNQLDFSETGILLLKDSIPLNSTNLLSHLVENKNNITENPLWQISRIPEQQLNPTIKLNTDSLTSFPTNSFFDNTTEDLCKERGAFNNLGAFWILNWTGLDQNLYLKHPCYDRLFDAVTIPDTIIVPCDEIDDLDLEIKFERCPPDCDRNSGTALARRKRTKKKRKRRSISPEDYCYTEEWIWKGYEFGDAEGTIILDSFEVVKLVMVIDTVPPIIQISPCDDCEGSLLPFNIELIDCDSAWLFKEERDTLISNNIMTVVYHWEATDFCGNTSSLKLEHLPATSPTLWYLDQDGDGFGDATQSVLWTTPLPGYVTDASDCDDNNSTIFPNAIEDYSTLLDENCNGNKEYFDQCPFAAPVQIIQASIEVSTIDATASGISVSNSCFDGTEADIWLTTTIPATGNLIINLQQTLENSLSSGNIEVYRNSCDSLEVLICENFNFLFDTVYQVPLSNLSAQTPILIRLAKDIWSADGIVAIATSLDNTTSSADLIQEQSWLKATPIPFDSSLQISFAVPITKEIELQLLNANGQLIQTILPKQKQTIEVYQTMLMTTHLADGLYFLVLQVDERQLVQKIIKQ